MVLVEKIIGSLAAAVSTAIGGSVARAAEPQPQSQPQAQPQPQEPVQYRCPDYSAYSFAKHRPLTGGRYDLAYQRPIPMCRRFNATEVEDTIEEMRRLVRDPDLFRLFENSFPNTLDTAITWHGVAAQPQPKQPKQPKQSQQPQQPHHHHQHQQATTDAEAGDEELTFITTGDINAMWLRDSANQLQSYRSLLRPNASRASLASLFRGAINLQARYIRRAVYCNAFLAPAEATDSPTGSAPGGGGGNRDLVRPAPPLDVVHECKYELDSLAAFLQLSHDYYARTGDVGFFGRRWPGSRGGVGSSWTAAVEEILAAAAAQLAGTYTADGKVRAAAYGFQRQTTSASETLANGGAGAPVRGGTGMVRSAFRPSDDACTYQLFVPGNMLFSRYLAACADIVQALAGGGGGGGWTAASKDNTNANANNNNNNNDNDNTNIHANRRYYHQLAQRMADFAESIRLGIERHGRVDHAVFGNMYAYEVDGFGSHNLMDDANIPSLLSAAMFGYVNRSDPVYQNTRRFVLSRHNPYFMRGPVINATGGPHVGTGMAWPMGLLVKIMTEDDDREIVSALRQLVSSTDGLGLIHESINSHDARIWTRQWFSWANGLFGQMLLDLRDRKPYLLSTSFQKCRNGDIS